MRFGLPDSAIRQLGEVFSRHPKIERAVLYGSRAKGTAKNGSDIDLTLVGADIDLGELARISGEIDDLTIPYSVDLSVYSQIENPKLTEHIERVGVNFYVRGATRGKSAGSVG